jgi:ATP-binding cassette, subfamily C, bacterial
MIGEILSHYRNTIFSNPFRSFRFISGSLLTGIAEAMTLGLLLPILNELTSSESSDSRLLAILHTTLGLFGLQNPSLGTLLILVLGMSLITSSLFITVQLDIGLFVRYLEKRMKNGLIAGVLRSDWKHLSHIEQGHFVNTLTREIDLVKGATRVTFASISHLVLFFSILGVCLTTSPTLVLVISVLILLFYPATIPVIKIANRLGLRFTQQQNVYVSNIMSLTQGLKNIKSASKEEIVKAQTSKEVNHVAHLYFLQKSVLAPFKTRYFETIGMFVACCLIYVAIVKINIPAAEVMLILTSMLFRMIPSLSQFFHCLTEISAALASFKAVTKIRKATPPSEEMIKEPLTLERIDKITMDDISFAYPSSAPLFQNLSLTLRRGEFWAITGATGTGKTTLLDIMAKLVQPNTGQLSVDGQPSAKIPNKEYHKHIAYLTQGQYIFSGTIEENITWGEKLSLPSRLKQAISIAQLTSLVNEKGLEHQILEGGTNLSGGQRQRISIARSLVHKVDFLLMDEPSSALDQNTEGAFFSELANLKGEVGVVIVTHRPEFLRHADKVIDFRADGRVVLS